MAKTIKKHGKSVLILGLLIVGVMWYIASLPGQAADTLLESDQLSESRPTTTANHSIYFKVQAAPTSSQSTIILDFDNSFLFTGVTTSDIDFATSSASSGCATATYVDEEKLVLYEDATAVRWGWATSAGSIMTFSPETGIDNESMATNTCVRIRIGTNATSSAGYGGPGVNQIVNGWPGVKNIDIKGGFGQTGRIKVAIIDGVVVTATISETLNVAVSASSTCTLLAGTDTAIESGTSTIAYGTLSTPDNFYDACQELNISTNAASGYVATLHKTQKLTNGSSDKICDGEQEGTNCATWVDQTPGCDGVNGTCSTTTEATWDTATNNGFGYCMKDRTLAGAAVADSGWVNGCGQGTQNFKLISNNSSEAQNIMKSNTATSSNYAYIGYRLTVDGAQPAGEYTTTLIYIVTPTY